MPAILVESLKACGEHSRKDAIGLNMLAGGVLNFVITSSARLLFDVNRWHRIEQVASTEEPSAKVKELAFCDKTRRSPVLILRLLLQFVALC